MKRLYEEMDKRAQEFWEQLLQLQEAGIDIQPFFRPYLDLLHAIDKIYYTGLQNGEDMVK